MKTNLTRADWLKNVCRTLNLKHKEGLLGGGIYPQKIAYWLRNWILEQLADGNKVELPGLGVFYIKKLKITLPERKGDVVSVIRFRPFESAKKLLHQIEQSVVEGS